MTEHVFDFTHLTDEQVMEVARLALESFMVDHPELRQRLALLYRSHEEWD